LRYSITYFPDAKRERKREREREREESYALKTRNEDRKGRDIMGRTGKGRKKGHILEEAGK